MTAGASPRGTSMDLIKLKPMQDGRNIDPTQERTAPRGAPWFDRQPPKKAFMKTNVGTLDRVLRIAIGLLLIALASGGLIGWWGLIGIVPLVSGLTSVCPAYSLLGLSTCPRRAP